MFALGEENVFDVSGMRELPQRKSIRLRGYNYSSNGAYFITICVKDKHKVLGEIVGRDTLGAPFMRLSEYGGIVNKEIEEMSTHYNGVVVDKFVVMPNHVHIIVSIGRDGAPGVSRPTTALIPTIVAALKMKTNRAIGFSIWQASYHDHIIRNIEEYQRIWKYIDENPSHWVEDCYYNV